MSTQRLLYPRLAIPIALSRLREWHGMDVEDVRDAADAWQPRTRVYEIGEQVRPPMLVELRGDIRELAARHGYPGSRRRSDLSAFDRAAGLRMLDEQILDVGSEEVWCHLTTALVPDVVVWRWGWPSLNGRAPEEIPARSFDRYLGKFHNSLRRMWYRLSTYGACDDDPPAVFWEDALVSVEERPSIGADPRVASLIFRSAEPLLEIEPYEEREAAMRSFARSVCEIAGWRELQTLNDEILEELLDGLVAEVVPGGVRGAVRESRSLQAARSTPPAREEVVDAAPETTAESAFDVQVTEGALQNASLSLRNAPDGFFPAWAGEAGRNLTFLLDGLGEPVLSDVVPGKRILRARGATRRFFEINDVSAGDVVRVSRVRDDTFRVEIV